MMENKTLTGSGTTYDTNKTLFQLSTEVEKATIPLIGTQIQRELDIFDSLEDTHLSVTPYFVGKVVGPPTQFEGLYVDDGNSVDELELCFCRDVAWSAAGSLPQLFRDEELPLLGSWTPFNKAVTNVSLEKCTQEYLPVTPHPPEYPVCKEYLDFLLDIVQDLDIPDIYVHSDEAVYLKLCHILWKNLDLYQNIVLLMGGFHQLRVRQKLLYKRNSCRGYKQWCVDAGIIAPGSADQAFEGRHYYRSMRIHKECFDALVQYKVESLTKHHDTTDSDLLAALVSLRKDPSDATLQNVIELPEFKRLVVELTQCEHGSDASMTVAYLKDVSSLLAMVSAVREGNIERHLQSERDMLRQVFSFNHHNYARYCSYQHVYLRSMETDNDPAFQELKAKGFGASIRGDPFSAVHGDLITEMFNRVTKGVAGPFRSGYSADVEGVNAWVNTIHIHSKVREAYREKVVLKTSSKHKELTQGGMQNHLHHVSQLKQQLRDYGVDQFGTHPAKCLANGVEINTVIVNDMLRAPAIGDSLFLNFVEERLIGKRKSFFEPIKRVKLCNGVEKKKLIPKEVCILKEDRQAFGYIVSKSVSMEDAFKHPNTSVPLAIANTDSSLRQSDKASLRNFLINESNSVIFDPAENCSWFIDGMAAVRSVKPQETYKKWCERFLQFITPPEQFKPAVIGIINDTYRDDSVKDGTRKQRAESDVRVTIG